MPDYKLETNDFRDYFEAIAHCNPSEPQYCPYRASVINPLVMIPACRTQFLYGWKFQKRWKIFLVYYIFILKKVCFDVLWNMQVGIQISHTGTPLLLNFSSPSINIQFPKSVIGENHVLYQVSQCFFPAFWVCWLPIDKCIEHASFKIKI